MKPEQTKQEVTLDKAAFELGNSLKKILLSEKYAAFNLRECQEVMAKASCNCIRQLEEERKKVEL